MWKHPKQSAKVVDRLMANDENLEIVVVDDNSDMIKIILKLRYEDHGYGGCGFHDHYLVVLR